MRLAMAKNPHVRPDEATLKIIHAIRPDWDGDEVEIKITDKHTGILMPVDWGDVGFVRLSDMTGFSVVGAASGYTKARKTTLINVMV